MSVKNRKIKIFFDVETTGLSPEKDKIVQIAAIKTNADLEIIDKIFIEKINPEISVGDSVKIHGLTNEELGLSNIPKFQDVLPRLKTFFADGDEIIAHNAPFDIAFLKAEFQNCKQKLEDPKTIIDTLEIARKKFPDLRNSLDALITRFNIAEKRGAHSAADDTEILIKVYRHLFAKEAKKLNLKTPLLNKKEKLLMRVSLKELLKKNTLEVKITEAEKQTHLSFFTANFSQREYLF